MLQTRGWFFAGTHREWYVKRRLTIISLILFLPSLVFAVDLFSLSFGSINQFQKDLFAPETQLASVIDVHNWATGGEMRAKVLGLDLDGYLLIQQGEIIDVTDNGRPVFQDDIAQQLFGMFGLGITTRVASFTTLSISAGTLTGLDISQGFGVSFWMGDRENVFSRETWRDFLAQTKLAYRMRLDLNLGNFSLGLHYQVPSQGFSYANTEAEALKPLWSQGKIGASFITRFL